MLSDSKLDRLVLTAIGWLVNSAPRAFGQGEWEQALAYLGADARVFEVSGAAEAIHAALTMRARRTG